MMRATRAVPECSPKRLPGVCFFRLVISGLVGLAVLTDSAGAQVSYTEEGGTLDDGTRYLIRVPSNWNGTLIRDLDYATGANGQRYLYLLEQGFAVSGTARHERRWAGFYDPAREIRHLDTVLDLFEARFRKPDRVIQYGCSGGGAVGLAVAEDFSDRVDGVIATGAHVQVWLMNTMLDGWFVLKTLIAPDLTIVDLPDEPGLRPQHVPIAFAWRQAIDDAQKTPGGRARIALAVAIGQWPDWTDPHIPNPDRNDVAALQQSMYLTLVHRYAAPGDIGGRSRYMFENPAGLRSAQLSWNTDVDYGEFFENGNEAQKRAVRELYREAGLHLEADLEKLEKSPRISADTEALEYWSAPGRTVEGNPRVPLLRMHEIGDPVVAVSPVQGYDVLVLKNRKNELYRTAFVEAPTHCGFTIAETGAAIEVMMRRLDTGRWESTEPQDLNALAGSLDVEGTVSRFVPFEPYENEKYNRTWTPN